MPRLTAEQVNFNSDKWVQQRIKEAVGKGSKSFKKAGLAVKFAENIAKAIDKEVQSIFPTIANRLIGQKSYATRVYYVFPGAFKPGQFVSNLRFDFTYAERTRLLANKSLDQKTREANQKYAASLNGRALAIWQPLVKSTVLRKRNSDFFVNTGQLHRIMQQTDGVGKLGSTKVVVTYLEGAQSTNVAGSSSYQQIVGNMRFTIFPNLPATQRGRLSTDAFRPDPTMALERRLFGSGETFKKLFGPPHRQRPLVQPVLHWYLRYKIPNTILGLLSRASTGRTK